MAEGLGEIRTGHKVSLFALTKKPSEIDLDNVSKNVGGNWRSLLTHLGVPSAKCKALLQESSSNTESACFQGLVFWREGNKPCKEASWSVLLEALEKGAERGDYAEELKIMVVQNVTAKTPNPRHSKVDALACTCNISCDVNIRPCMAVESVLTLSSHTLYVL
jgi:hypothetical protein